ncbi:hypothetical protein SAURM35S_03464 [Streptomyces aurantiogriseus]
MARVDHDAARLDVLPLDQPGPTHGGAFRSLIVRTHETGDRRRVRVRLTEAGHAAFERHAATEEAGETGLLSVLSAAERRPLADLLRKLVLAAEAEPDAPAPAPG